jgi:hypothetical protein
MAFVRQSKAFIVSVDRAFLSRRERPHCHSFYFQNLLSFYYTALVKMYIKRIVDMMRSGLLITFFLFETSIYMMLKVGGCKLF